MPENKHLRFLLKLLYILLTALGLWLFFQVLFPWLLPFLIALALSWLLERPAVFLIRRFHIKRWLASALCTLILILLLCGGLGLLLWRAGYEVALLLGRLPTLLAGLPTMSTALEDWVYRFTVALPVQFQDFFQQALEGLISQGVAIPHRFYDFLAGAVAGFAMRIPDGVLFFFTTALATYFSSAGRPGLMEFFSKQLPRTVRARLGEVRALMKGALGGWLRAQGILMLVTFGELTAGLLILRVDLALLLAAVISLVDALPIFGTGTILFPWALLSLLSGDWRLAAGLAVLYGVVSLVRNLLEPKLVGDRIGLHPLAALLAMYLGFQAFGVVGMIFSPLLAIIIKQVHDSGMLRLWKE